MSEELNGTTNIVSTNILKCRDDPKPVFLVKDPLSELPRYNLSDASTCSWARPEEELSPDKLRPRIEPWLTALCQSEHLSLLLGSGLSHAIHHMATGKRLPGMGFGHFGDEDDIINTESARSANASGRGNGNIEDQIRVANELLRGLEVIASTCKETKERSDALRKKLGGVLADFANSILKGEQGLINAGTDKRELAFNYFVSFLMSFASRTGTRDRLNIFTTNYDRIIEAGANWLVCICWTDSLEILRLFFVLLDLIWICIITRQELGVNLAI